MAHAGSGSSSGSSDSMRSGSGSNSNSLHSRLHSLRFRRWACPAGEYSELATLLHSGQEELVKHLLSRDDDGDDAFPSLETLAVFLPLYFAMAVAALGLAVPAGNFIPALTIGAALGRLEATLLLRAGIIHRDYVGHYALVGAAAALGGVTRMTMTIAVILAEVTDDVVTLPACMLALAVARLVGDILSSSFDHGMIELLRVPFLHECPPRIFEVLTAKDVMASQPMRLLEVTTVRDIVHVLRASTHNGFPIVCGSCISYSISKDSSGVVLVGLILRRQLLVLLTDRVWQQQMLGIPMSLEA
jgi:chloride channel 7